MALPATNGAWTTWWPNADVLLSYSSRATPRAMYCFMSDWCGTSRRLALEAHEQILWDADRNGGGRWLQIGKRDRDKITFFEIVGEISFTPKFTLCILAFE